MFIIYNKIAYLHIYILFNKLETINQKKIFKYKRKKYSNIKKILIIKK